MVVAQTLHETLSPKTELLKWAFFLRKISPELTSAPNPPLFAEEGWP